MKMFKWYLVTVLLVVIASITIVFISNKRYNDYVNKWNQSEYLIIEEINTYIIVNGGYKVCIDTCYIVRKIQYHPYVHNGVYLELRKKPQMTRQQFMFSKGEIYDIKLIISTVDI